MLDEIEKLEGPSAISEMKKREDCVSDFIRWAKDQNIYFDNVELKTVRDSELGVFAKQQLEKAVLLHLKRCKLTYYNSSFHGNSVELIMTTVSYSSP